MKKLITITCSLIICGAAFAQTVDWSTISGLAVTADTNTVSQAGLPGGIQGPVQGTVAAGTAYYFELLVGSVYTGTVEAVPTTIAGLASWTDSGLEAENNQTTAGRLVTLNSSTSATAIGMSTTVSNNIILVGWSANLGSTWAAALEALESPSLSNLTTPTFFGTTSVGYVEASTVSPGTELFGSASSAYGTPIYSLDTQLYEIVPEPGTLALAAIGSTSLFLLRRKNK